MDRRRLETCARAVSRSSLLKFGRRWIFNNNNHLHIVYIFAQISAAFYINKWNVKGYVFGSNRIFTDTISNEKFQRFFHKPAPSASDFPWTFPQKMFHEFKFVITIIGISCTGDSPLNNNNISRRRVRPLVPNI